MDALLEIFMARHRQIERGLADKTLAYPELEAAIPRPFDLTLPARQLLNTVVGVTDGNFCSWIPGIPLPAQLAGKRRTTVDIAPHFLENMRRDMGITEKALFAFGRRKMLLFNIRDFDPEGTEQDIVEGLAVYRPYTDLLRRMFDEAGDAVYFLPTLRTRLFDAVPDLGGTIADKTSLRSRYDEAGALAGAAAAAAALPDSDAMVRASLFRGERAPLKATRWHWAYVNAMARFVDHEPMKELRASFAALAAASGDNYVIGTLYLSLQQRLRYLHLLYSAPLSASFGGPYGFSVENEATYMQAVQQQTGLYEYDYYPDDVMLLIHDLQLGRLREQFRRYIDDRLWESVKYMSATSYERLTKDSYYHHFDDEENIAEMIDYFDGEPQIHLGYEGLEREMDALLRDGDAIEARHLVGLATRSAELLHAKAQPLRRATEGALIAKLATPEDVGRPGTQVR